MTRKLSAAPAAVGRRLFGDNRLRTAAFFAVCATTVAGCYGCDGPTAGKSTIAITGPEQVVAGQAVEFTVDGQGIGDGKSCPDILNWHLDGTDKAQPVRKPPRTRTATGGACVTDGETVRYTFPAGQPGGEYVAKVSVELGSDVVSTAYGEKRVVVTTPGIAPAVSSDPTSSGPNTPPPAPGGGLAFGSAASYGAGDHAMAVGAGRFDSTSASPGSREVVVASDTSDPSAKDRLHYFPTSENGALASPSSFDLDVGADPGDLDAEDFNGDGITDVAVASTGNDEVELFARAGSGPLFNGQDVAVGAAPQAIAHGLLDGDAHVDLVTANAADNTVSVLLNNTGSVLGNFRLDGSPASGGTGPTAVAVGDVTGDVLADIVVGHQSGGVTVLRNLGGGSFASAVKIPGSDGAGELPFGLAIRDLDQDSKRDIVVADHGTHAISVLFNDGSSSYTEKRYPASGGDAHGQGPRDIAIGDFDYDGRPDVASANAGSDNASVLVNSGGRAFSNPIHVAMGTEAVSIAAADLNGDDRADLATANYGGPGTVTVALASPPSSSSASSARVSAAAAPGGDAAARRRKNRNVTGVGRFSGSRVVKKGRASYGADGIGRIRDAVVSTRLVARLTGSRRTRAQVPAAFRRALNADVVGALDGERHPAADGTGRTVVAGMLVARSRGRDRTVTCWRVRFDSAPAPGRRAANTATLLGGTGVAATLRATGTFPAIDLDAVPRQGPISLKVTRGAKRKLPRACTSLAKQLPKPGRRKKR